MHPSVSTQTEEHELQNIAPVHSSLINLNQWNEDAIETTWNKALTGHYHTMAAETFISFDPPTMTGIHDEPIASTNEDGGEDEGSLKHPHKFSAEQKDELHCPIWAAF